jgi:hypothetical protein
MRGFGLCGVVLVSVAVGCGPGGQIAVDTDGDSETGTGSSTGEPMSSASASATAPTTANPTAASASADGSDDGTTTNVDPDSTGTAGSDAGTDGPPCIPGELDCPCDIGSICDGDLQCVEGTCVATPACEQPEGEPNDDEASAIDLGQLDCGGMAIATDGALDGAADEDWFTLTPDAGVVCFADPTATAVGDGDAEMTVCIYADCNMGGTNVGCGFGMNAGTPDTSPDGAEGCCNTGTAVLDSVTCGAFDQSYVSWVRVSAAQDQCLPYSLTLEY